MSTTLSGAAAVKISGACCALTLCGRPSNATSQPRAASAGGMFSKRSDVRPVSGGCTAPSGSPTWSTLATRTSSTSGWISRRRIISAPP